MAERLTSELLRRRLASSDVASNLVGDVVGDVVGDMISNVA